MQRIAAVGAIAVAIGSLISAQSATETIRGRVVADDTGEPIANVRVAAPAGDIGSPVTLTDDAGRFTLTVAASSLRIIASKTGYGRREIARSAGATTVDIRLQRGAVVSGHVVDERGEPVQAARVAVHEVARARAALAPDAPGPPPPPGFPRPVPQVAVTDTDDRGDYRLPSLPAGTYFVSVVTLTPTMEPIPGTNQLGSRPAIHQQFYPGTENVDEAQRIELGPGDDRPSVDFVVAGARPVASPGVVIISPLARVQPRPGATATAVIRGRVVGTDGRSLANALVTLYGGSQTLQQSSARADAEGRFELRDLPAGTYYLMAVKTGFGPVAVKDPAAQPGPFGQPSLVVKLADGETRERADITLPRWGTIEGRIVDERGDPVQNARVQVMQVRYDAGRRRLTPIGFARPTDDLGRYRLFGIAPGQYVVSAAVGDVQSLDVPGYARVYYPRTTNPGQAQFVSVALAQDVLGIDLALSRVQTARVTGKMVDSGGAPTQGGSVNLISSQRSASLANVAIGARIAPDGQFEFANVAPGQYIIQAYKGRAGRSAEGEFGTIPVTVNGTDVKDLVLQTSRGSTIHGHVTFDSADTSKRPPANAIEIAPLPVDFDLSPPSVAIADIHDDWTFDIAGVNGPRRLQLIRTPPGWMLENVVVNGVSAIDRPLPFGRADQSLRDVEIVLTDRLSELAGTVTDDTSQPAAGSHVIVFPTDRDRWYPASRFLRTALAGADGTFTIVGLPFGSYYVAAVPRLPDEGDDAWQDASFLNAILLRASSLTVRDGTKQTVSIRVSTR
jgi:protocatechuate 3,4-dioxygenase beta subunit